MRKYVMRAISLILMFVFIVPSHAQEYQARNVHGGTVEGMQSQFVADAAKLSTLEGVTYSVAKQVTDFAGNGYTVIEYSPVGYFIFHNASGKYVEYAENALSPYYGYYENIYYGGPTEYYVKIGEAYYHTMLDNVQFSSVYESEMAVSSEQLNRNLSTIPVGTSENMLSTTDQSDMNSYITNGKNFFVGNTSFGYVDGGYCGYIAASMVLQYYDYIGRIELGNVAPSGVTYRLIHLELGYDHVIGSGGETYPWTVARVLNNYCSTYNISGTANWAAGIVGVVNEITSNRPAIIMGYLNNAKWHAVVAYGIQFDIDASEYNYIVHYGWTTAGYDHVVLNGACTGNVKFSV